MDARELKALQIAATMPVRRSTYGWLVPSQTGNGTSYKVAWSNPKLARLTNATGDLTCTCPDFELRGLPCKHVLAVTYTIKREVVTDEGVLTQELKVTYTQDWTAYNAAQCEEKERFGPMLADLCSTIPNPPQGRGRPRLPMSDMAYRVRVPGLCGSVRSSVRQRRTRGQVQGLDRQRPALQLRPALTPLTRDDSRTDRTGSRCRHSRSRGSKRISRWTPPGSRPRASCAGTTTSGARK